MNKLKPILAFAVVKDKISLQDLYPTKMEAGHFQLYYQVNHKEERKIIKVLISPVRKKK